MSVGYVRCSTAEQNEVRQLKMMEEQKGEMITTFLVLTPKNLSRYFYFKKQDHRLFAGGLASYREDNNYTIFMSTYRAMDDRGSPRLSILSHMSPLTLQIYSNLSS